MYDAAFRAEAAPGPHVHTLLWLACGHSVLTTTLRVRVIKKKTAPKKNVFPFKSKHSGTLWCNRFSFPDPPAAPNTRHTLQIDRPAIARGRHRPLSGRRAFFSLMCTIHNNPNSSIKHGLTESIQVVSTCIILCSATNLMLLLAPHLAPLTEQKHRRCRENLLDVLSCVFSSLQWVLGENGAMKTQLSTSTYEPPSLKGQHMSLKVFLWVGIYVTRNSEKRVWETLFS